MLAVFIMYRNPITLITTILLLMACETQPWYTQVEKLSDQQISNHTLDEADIVYNKDIFPIQTPFNDYPETAFKALLNTKEFTNCCAPMPYLQVLYYHVLMNQPKREKIFLELLNRANKAGKLYALVALSKINYDLFKEKVIKFLDDSTQVKVAHWDVGPWDEAFNKVLVSDWSKKHLLKDKSVETWLNQNPPSERDSLCNQENIEYDVLNGCWVQDYNKIKDWEELYQKM